MITVGDPAPPLVLSDRDGAAWSLRDHAGSDVVLIFHRHFY